jgi:hypothetical protein
VVVVISLDLDLDFPEPSLLDLDLESTAGLPINHSEARRVACARACTDLWLSAGAAPRPSPATATPLPCVPSRCPCQITELSARRDGGDTRRSRDRSSSVAASERTRKRDVESLSAGAVGMGLEGANSSPASNSSCAWSELLHAGPRGGALAWKTHRSDDHGVVDG